MYKEDTIYYPPDEMHTLFIPVTRGCSYNLCKFCSMYKEDSYSEVNLSDIEMELMNGDRYTERVFLTGADPLNVGFEKMLDILERIERYLPYCACVSSYASISNISKYSLEELKILHNRGLRLLYIGFESGYDYALEYMNKNHRLENSIRQAKKLNQANITFNTIIMLGIAGADRGLENGLETAKMINRFKTRKIITMNLKIFHGTELNELLEKGDYKNSSQEERLMELKILIENIDRREDIILDTSHTTNFIKISGTLPRDREELLGKLDRYKEKRNS